MRETLYALAFSPDGRALATGHAGGSIRLRDPATGEVRRTLQGPQDIVWSIAFSPDGEWILSGWSDGAVRLFEVATGKELLRLDGHQGLVLAVEFGPGPRTALSSSFDKTALLWDLRPHGTPARVTAALWDDLAADDAAKAYRAVWALRDDPPAAVALLRDKLPPARPAADEKKVRALVADLDADAFAVREKATKELAALGSGVLPLLRRELQTAGSQEARRRLQALVSELTPHLGPDAFRRWRAEQALELAGTAEARALLREWAAGLPNAELTEEARAALGRLEKADRVQDAARKH